MPHPTQILAHAGHGDGVSHDIFHLLSDPVALSVLAALVLIAGAGVAYRRWKWWRR